MSLSSRTFGIASGFQFKFYLFMGANLPVVKPDYFKDFEIQDDVKAEASGDNYRGDRREKLIVFYLQCSANDVKREPCGPNDCNCFYHPGFCGVGQILVRVQNCEETFTADKA